MDELCIRTSGSPLQGELLAGMRTFRQIELAPMLAGNPRRFGQGLEVGDRIHTEAERHLFLQVLNRVLKGFAEAVKKLVDLGLADDQRRAASDDVAGQRSQGMTAGTCQVS